MEIKFEVLLSSSIKRKKPWPSFCWLGKEKEGVFLLDDNRISEINLASGQTKKKIPKLQPMLPRVLTMSGSQNGMWLAGVLVSGEVFLWHRDRDSLKMVTPVPAVYELVSAAPRCISLLVSGDGQKVLLATRTGQVFLWECVLPQDLKSIRDVTVKGRWSQIASSEDARLPSAKDKEATLHSLFVQSQALGEVSLSAFVFTSGEQLVVTFLKIQWDSSSEGCRVQWATRSYPLSQLVPPCQAVKSRGALIAAFSPDGKLLAIVLNQKDPRATQVLFISVQNFVTISSVLGGCGSKNFAIPPKYIRSYWVGSVGWTPEGLYLACVLKRGSLLMLARLGGLVSVSTGGCDIEFGPAHFLPLHPLVTYRPPASSQPPDDILSSSGASLRDRMRQRYSVTWHPRLPCLIVSDGYMATVLKMPTRPSSASLMSCLLLDTAQKLERVRMLLGSEQPQVKSRLESMSTLRFTASLSALKERETPDSTLPLFFRDGGETGGSRLTMEKAQVEDDDQDSDGGQYAGSLMEDGGRLEFASMFDTLHAPSRSLVESGEPEQDSSALLQELGSVRRSLLTAWALGVSLGGAMDQRERLLKYAVSCSVRLARLLCIADSVVSRDKGTQISNCFELLRSLLSFLPWDSSHDGGASCSAVVVDLAQRFVQIFVPSSSGAVRTSQNFAAALVVLREVSRSLNQACRLPQKTYQGQNDRPACPSDMFFVPFFQDDEQAEAETSNRLVAVWRELYTQALQYQEVLRSPRQGSELENMTDIVCQIQAVLQRAGDQLGESPALHSITGEQHFILGEYSECIQAWRVQLWAEREQVGPRACFLETRYCLALLFGLLFQYRLKEAQAMCDRMARQLLTKGSQDLEDNLELRASSMDEARFDFWLPHRVNSEAAHAVVQTLGRFMASYFTNQPLAIFPPHNVDLLPPLHMQQLSGRRMVPLSQARVAGAVRTQHLSGVWTVDYALELLLLGGLMPEAVWLAQSLGDWKMAASLGLAYATYCTLHYDFSRLKWRELHLPPELQPGSIFQAQLESLLGCTGTDGHDQTLERLPDLVEVEDMELLQVSVQEILRASVMADVDVVSPSLTQLLESAKEHASSLPALVPPAFYLPAPPLYCPQPAPNTQDSVVDLVMTLERESRCHVAASLQRSLLLFRAAHCSRPAAQWYVTGLRRCRRLLSKVRKGNVGPENNLSEGLKRFTNRRGFFRLRPSGNQNVNAVAKQTMACFREMCGLCWMLHVRDELTVSCRRYQAARNRVKDSKATDLVELCVEVLRWACRLLPFSRFLNAEETLQDLVLSLVAELPPIPMVAETLVIVFSVEEDSVRVPLREKYSTLLRRLNPCTVQSSVSKKGMQQNSPGEEESGETMMLLIQEQRRQRAREERRLARRLVPVERYIWERDEEDDGGGADTVLNRFSLGTSLSNSTLTNSDCTPLDSEEGTSDTIHSSKPQISSIKSKAEEKDRSKQREKKTSSTPVVGTWMFELDDEEYLRFLELFLSYVLEKDSVDSVDDSELPLLSSFSSRLHDRELHSDTFDVMTTLKRHQAGRKRGVRLPAFRAGSCFHVLPETPEPLPSIGPAPSVLSEAHMVQTNAGARPFRGRQPGLFGLQRLKESPYRGNAIASEPSPIPKSLQERFKIVSCPDLELQLELDSKLEAQFPQLARLLEWMLRWADRSVLLTRSTGKNAESAAKPAVIRVKSSAPAVLSALRLMELRYSAALHGAEEDHVPIRISERELCVAPVVQTETDWKREQESSMDMGYPGSAETPVTLPDLDRPHKHSSEVCEDLNEEQRASHLYEYEDRNSEMDIKGEERRRKDELSLLGESDGDSSEVVSLEKSFIPSISVQIKSRTCRPRGQALTLEDLKSSKTPDDSSESCSEEISTLLKTPVMEAASSVHEAPEPASLQQPERQRPSVSEAPVGFETASQTQSCSVPQNGECNPDPVRQLLQDELFRLVQLQQINFMSLMQVVGASFANTALSQANPLSSQLSVPSSQAVHLQTQDTAALPSHKPPLDVRNTRGENADRPNSVSELQCKKNKIDQQTSCRESEHDDRSSPINPGFNNQEIQHLTICSDWPQDSQADFTSDQRFIPHSQGLLTTVKNQETLQAPSNLRPQIHSTPLERPAPKQGLRLLRLPPPAPVREAWPPHRSDLNHYKPALPRRSEDYTRESMAQAPHVNFNRWTSQDQFHIPEASLETRSGREEPVCLPPATNWAVPTMGPRLLHVSPDTQARPIQQLHFPYYSAEGQTIVNTAGVPRFLKLQQLHIDPGLSRTGVRYDEPPAHTPRLIPLEKLRAWEVGQSDNIPRPQLLRIEPEPPRGDLRYDEAQLRTPRLIPLEELMAWARTKQEVKLQLLKADMINHSKGTTSPSKKRLKRREDKKKERGDKKEKKVSFRPNDSVIPPSQLEEAEPTQDDGYAIPSGSLESTLTGQRLLAEVYATSAELHAFAATQKHPPEVHDACTNTDPGSPHSTTDEAVSPQVPVPPDSAATCDRQTDGVPGVPPQMYSKRHTPDTLVPEKPATSGQVALTAQMNETFVTVTDLEDGTHLQDQLFSQMPAQDTSCPPLTSAQLHLLAASVINPALSNAEVQTEDRWDESPGSAPPELVYSKPEQKGDPVTLKVLTEVRGSEGPHRLIDRTPFTLSQASADLVDMDARLAVLKNIADHMDTEFTSMRLLVNTIDTPVPLVLASGEDELRSSSCRDVQEAQRYKRHVELEDVEEEEEEEPTDRRFTSTPRAVVPPGHREQWKVTASVQSSAHLQTSPTAGLTGSLMEDSRMLPESTLGLTGLSDVADILRDLVKDGALSPSAFHLNTTVSSLNPEEEQRKVKTDEEEKKDLSAWMKRKQQERLADYRKQREEKREKERQPFTSKFSLKPTSRDLQLYNKKKEEKNKVILQKHHSQRVHEACSLMTEMLTSPLVLPAASTGTTKAQHQDSKPGSQARATGKNRSPRSQRGRSRSVSSLGRTVVLQRRGTSAPPGTLGSRLGLHRPASALPGDRLSQVTRRGMLTDRRGRTRAPVHRPESGLNKCVAEPKALKQREDKEERDVVSPWDVPLEIRQILGLESSIVGQGLIEQDEDILSESTGSVLSKLDWAAIERIVAEEGEF